MEKEEIALVAQLLTGIKDALVKLERAQKMNNTEEATNAKREILHFQKQINTIL